MIAGFLTNNLCLFKIVSWVWLVVMLLDFVVPTNNQFPESKNITSHTLIYRLAIWFWLPVQATVILCGLFLTAKNTLTIREYFLITASIGISSGMFCGPVAHELMHKGSLFDKVLAELLMMSISYTHFCVEHIDGHHRRVGTIYDPATARLGESFYAFYPRAVFGGLINAWSFERARLKKIGLSLWNIKNRMNRYVINLTLVYVFLFFQFGWLSIGFFVLQSIIAFSMIELINYIEHYGLIRQKETPTRYERVKPHHSWDSNHRISNWMLFNVGFHSDHHLHANKPFYLLKYQKQAPQLPYGYFTMFFIPLFPALWRTIMDPRVAAISSQPQYFISL